MHGSQTLREVADDPFGRPEGWSYEGWMQFLDAMLHGGWEEPSDVTFPVGTPEYNAVDWTGAIISDLVGDVTPAEVWSVSETVDRRDTSGEEAIYAPRDTRVVENELYELILPGGNRYIGTLAELGNHPDAVLLGQPLIPEDAIFGPEAPSGLGGEINELPGEPEMGWYDDIDRDYFDGMLPGGVPPNLTPGIPGFGPGNVPSDPAVPVNPIPSSPGVTPSLSGCGVDDPMKNCVYKRVCGQWRWVKQKRRRRKQLFTQRDAQQMSSLLGSLPAGAAGVSIAKTWIASHPS